jgi:hypothetical protein
MKRRDFLKQSAAGAAVTVLSRVQPSAFASDAMAKVALVRTGERAKGIEAAMKLIPFSKREKGSYQAELQHRRSGSRLHA